MKKQLKTGLFAVLFIITVSSLVTSASASTTEPLSPGSEFIDPRGGMLPAIKRNFIYFFANMKDANFSTGDVFYDYYNTGNRIMTLQNINQARNFDQTFNLVSLNTTLNTAINKLETFNDTVYSWWDAADSTWNNATFQSGLIVNQSYFASLEHFYFAYFAYAIWEDDIGDKKLEIGQFAAFCLGSNPWTWRYRVTQKIAGYFDVGLSFLTRLDSNIFNAVPKLLTYLKNIQSEITAHSSLDFSYQLNIALKKQTVIHADILTVLLDPDLSVINALEAFRENKTRQGIFTGDETINVVNLVRTTETITGAYSQQANWTYDDGSSPELLTVFFADLFRYSLITRNLVEQLGPFGYNLGLVRNFAGLRTFNYDSSVNGTKTSIRESFDISQLQVREVDIATATGLVIKDVAFNYIEHHSLGLFVYNDSNSNGFMDLTMLDERGELYTNSTEMLYKVDFTTAETKTVAPPETVSNELSFGISFGNASADLRPFHDKTIDPGNVLQTSVSEIGFTFHYEVNRTGERPVSDLKFDYIIGDWTSDEPEFEFEGLSLAQMFVSTFTRSHLVKKVERVINEQGSDFQDANTTRRNSRFKFGLEDLEIGEITLDEIDYTWNGTTDETAYGQTIPLVFFKMVYGAHETNGDVARSILGATEGKSFLYSISYSVWSGESIVHDPTFSVVSGAVIPSDTTTETEETKPTTPNGGLIPGFEAWMTLLAVPVLVYVYKKRK
ncbi:MAG: hypothetical protein ACFFD4_07475 [Candidatus Odinarchaeota archaeon]